MPKLKISTLPDEKPVRVTVELPAIVHRDLLAYAKLLSQDAGQPAPDPAKLVAVMVTRFMATDRAFARSKRGR
ncbi:conserved hypothetical protein [Bradyrhizobium sp. ORS 375]|uniref:DUF2274 domain-containing protein n=1 Tax=Bradyrhizobium sp. (strain ORS 375) TaxID=566679 RepID=UPI000240AD6A|nr:DUF2274 domain-containing protein [Bradyrhizobium sp. ORS 375]CCD93507.1 conserved hypothetical protein [Bradyrhizobium sp. ORS 375]